MLDLGWADGILPDPADGLNGLVSGLKSAFKKLPAPVRKVFAGVKAAYLKAPDREAFARDVAETIRWASRNPKTSQRMVESGKGLDDLIQVARTTSKLDSEKLTRNMLAQNPGLVKKEGYAAHHIVAGNDPRAEEARRLLEKFGIDINAAENGVFLPQSRKVMNGENYHPSLHTRPYFEEVKRRLERATTKEEAIEELRKIADELSTGKFPR